MSTAPRFRVQLVEDEGQWVELPDKGTLVLGSSPDRAGFVVPGQGVDDAHCAIGRVKGGGYAIKDLGGRYGTLVNGKKVSSARLQHNDEITLGATRVRVLDTSRSSSDASTVPPADKAPASRSEASLEPAPISPEQAQRKSPKNLPQRIGGFRIERLLGRGGMGEVYLAVQENLDRPVALKVLNPKRAADAAFVAGFQAEARAAAALHHPNVVIVHDVGEADGRHYLSMEYMAGSSLEARVSGQGPLPWRAALDVLHDAAKGLEFAEGKGIVHRDIKPANLMVDGTGTTKIADLGLATGDESDDGDGKIYGTPHFISPEQARGEAVDGRSDLYSLGATAYRLITGRTPFEGDSAREILRGHLKQTPTKIEEVPEAVDALVQKLLSKEPGERFQSAADLAREIDKLRVAADHGAPAEEASGGGKKVGLIGGLVALVVAAVFGSGVLGGSDDPEPIDEGSEALAGNQDDAGDPAQPAPDPTEDFFDAGKNDAPTVDEESELRVLELQAELAYSKLDPSLDRTARIAALEALVGERPTTSIAGRARSEIEELEGEQRREEAAERRRALALAGASDALRSAAGWPPTEEQPPNPVTALVGLSAFQPGDELASSPEFAPLRTALFGEIVGTSTAYFEDQLTRVETLLSEGAFADARSILSALAPPLALPAPGDAVPDQPDEPGQDSGLPEGTPEPSPLWEVPAEHGEAYAKLRSLATRRNDIEARLSEREEAWEKALIQADERRLAAALGPKADGVRLLAERDLAGLSTHLEAVAGDLQTQAARTRLAGLTSELPYASKALDALVQGFDAGEWRRQTIIDTTGRRTKNREAIGARPGGILIDRGGQSELRPWKVFGPREVHQLFKARLLREYTSEEQRGIVALIVLAAVADIQERVERYLSPARKSVFRPEDAEEIAGAFGAARDWAEQNPGMPAEALAFLEREENTAKLLGGSLLAAEEGRWAQAVSGLERLFAEGPGSFLLSLFSNGEDWRQPAPIAAAQGKSPGDSSDSSSANKDG